MTTACSSDSLSGHQADAILRLHRLKQATMAEQEDEEDKMRWRIEAEVRLALEAAQQAQAQREAHYQRELAGLKVASRFDFI